MYRVLLERGAERDLARLSSEIHHRVIAAIQALANKMNILGDKIGDVEELLRKKLTV